MSIWGLGRGFFVKNHPMVNVQEFAIEVGLKI